MSYILCFFLSLLLSTFCLFILLPYLVPRFNRVGNEKLVLFIRPKYEFKTSFPSLWDSRRTFPSVWTVNLDGEAQTGNCLFPNSSETSFPSLIWIRLILRAQFLTRLLCCVSKQDTFFNKTLTRQQRCSSARRVIWLFSNVLNSNTGAVITLEYLMN